MTQALFSPEGEVALAEFMAAQPLLAFDFDGTLAPIVARPEAARVPLAMARRLDRLASLLPVAVITGRRIDDVRERLSFSPLFLIGNHGAEDQRTAGQTWAMFDELRARCAASHERMLTLGVVLEDKGLSLALHHRLAMDQDSALALIHSLVEGLGPGISVHGGKRVVNIVSATAPDKAQALASLHKVAGARAVVFVGDDINDEPVFVRQEPTWLTIKIGRDDPHSKAMFFLDATSDMVSMLDRMLACLTRPAKTQG